MMGKEAVSGLADHGGNLAPAMTTTNRDDSYADRYRVIEERTAEAEARVRAAEEEFRAAQARVAETRAAVTEVRQERIELMAAMRGDSITWAEIGRIFGISQQRASQLGKKHGIS